MSAQPDISGSTVMDSDMAPGARPSDPGKTAPARFDFDWILRPIFGLLLAGLALAAMVGGGAWFAAFIAVVTIAGVREWHRMVRHGRYFHYVAIGALAIAASLALLVIQVHVYPAPLMLALAVLAAAATFDAVVAAVAGVPVLWQAVGPLYLGIPGIALYALRDVSGHGLWLVLFLFLAVWATDTGALVSGKLIGGPKLAPVLSPNKTWAGFAGGTMLAAATVAGAMLALGGSALRGAAFGAALALVAHVGDLFESWVKRRVGRKNSGHLIPGHGGVLDRIDSILFAAPACAAFTFVFGAPSIFGAPL